jgi:hypothetical protein
MAKQEGKDKLAKIYGYLSETYDETPKDYETFKRFMADETYANKIHKALIADEDVKVDTDYNTFADKVGLKKKAVSPTSATTSKPAISEQPVTSQASGAQPAAKQPKPLLYDPEKERIAANQRSEQLQTNPEIKKKEREQLLSTAIDNPEKLKRYQLKEAEVFLDENKDKDPYYATKKEKIKKALGDTGQSQASDLTNRFFKGIVQLVPDASNTVAVLAKKIDTSLFGVDKPLTDYQTRQWGIAAQELIDSNLVTNQYFDEDELAMLSNGLGQVVSTVGLALLSKGSSAEAQALGKGTLPEIAAAATKNTAGIRTAAKEILRREAPEVAGKVFSEQSLTKTALETLGKSTKQIAIEAAAGVPAKLFNPASLAAGSQVFASTFEEATRAGADFDTAFKVSAKNAGITTTLAILPMEAILKSAEGIGKISLKEYTKNAIKAAGTEGLTEGFEQYYANLNAQETYDLNRKLMDGVLLNAKGGSVIGGFMSAFLGLKNLSLKKANETNDPRLKEQAEEFNRILPKELGEQTTPREEVSVTNSGNQRDRAKAELMPNVPIPTQQVLGNTPSITAPIIDTTQQAVKEVVVEEVSPVEAAENLVSNADVSGNGTTVALVGEAADKIIAAVDSIEQKPATKIIRRKRAGEKDEYLEVAANYQLTENEKNIGTEEQNLIDNGVLDVTRIEQPTEALVEPTAPPAPVIELVQPVAAVPPTPTEEATPIEEAPTEPTPKELAQKELEAQGISAEPILNPETLPQLGSVDEVPTNNPQPVYIGSNGVLLKDTEGKVYSPSGNVSKLVDEAIDNEPEIFDNGNQPDVPEEIDNEQELFDFYMQSDNPLYVAEAIDVAGNLGDDITYDNSGSREQVLSGLIYRLTPEDLIRYGKGNIDQLPKWLQNIVKRNEGKKSTIDVDAENPEQSDLIFTPEEVTDHIEALANMPESQGKKQLDEWLSDKITLPNTNKQEAIQKFEAITGLKITEEQARKIVSSNPFQTQRVQGVDSEGNEILTPQREFVFKEELVTTDEFGNPTKTEKKKVRRDTAQQKIIKNAEKAVSANLAKLAEANPKSDVQTALDKVKELWKNGGIMPVTLNMGGSPMFTPQAKAAFSELIRAIKASGAKKVKDIAQQLYDILPDNIKGNTNAVDFEPLVQEVISEQTGQELKDAVRVVVKLYKQLNPTKIYEKSPVYDYVKTRIAEALGELNTEQRAEIEALVDEELKPTTKQDKYDAKEKGKKKTTKQVQDRVLSPLTKELIEQGKLETEYTTTTNDAELSKALKFVKENTIDAIMEYLRDMPLETMYPDVAFIMQKYLEAAYESAKQKGLDGETQANLRDLFNEVEKLILNYGTLTATNLQSYGKNKRESVQEVLEFEQIIEAQRQKIEDALKDKASKEQIELERAEMARAIKEAQQRIAEKAKEAGERQLLVEARLINRKLRQQLGQAIQRADLNVEELLKENTDLRKLLTNKKPAAAPKPKTAATQKLQQDKAVRKTEEQKLVDAITSGKFFLFGSSEKNTLNQVTLPRISPEGRKALASYIKALAEEGITRLQVVAERIYDILPQALKEQTTASQWEDYILSITEEVDEDRVSAGTKNLSERIEKDIEDRILRGEATAKDKLDPVANIVAELYKIYREQTAGKEKSPKPPKTAAQFIQELVAQYDAGSDVWTAAQNKIEELYGDNEVVMEALSQYFNDTPLNLPVAKKTIQKSIREYIKNTGQTLEQIIRSRQNIIKDTGANTRQIFATLMPDVSLDVIDRLVEAVEGETAIIAKAKADQILERYFASKEKENKAEKKIKQRMLEDIVLARYTDAESVIAGINVKYGTDIRTVEELSDLAKGLINANTDEQVNEALKTFARWTPEGAKLAQRINKTQDALIAEAESNTILDPIALTLKALHDVAKQNKAVEGATKAKPSVIDTMRAVIGMQNKGEARRIWETAQEIIDRELERRFANDPEGLTNARQQIAEYFGHTPLAMAIPKKDFARAVNEKLKELLQGKTLIQAVREYDNIAEQTKLSLKEVLLQGFDLTIEEAEAYSNAVNEATDKIIKAEAEREAKRQQPKPPKARAGRIPLAVKIAQLLALKGAGVNEADIDELIKNKYGVDISDTQTNTLAVAAKAVAIAFKNGGVTSSAYKAASQTFEKALAKIRKDNPWVDKLNVVTNAALLSGIVGRASDVVSNITLSAIELAKTSLEFPLTLSKADWNRYKAKLRFAQAVVKGVSQGRKIAKLQLQGKITDINRYSTASPTNIEAMIEQSTGLPKAYLQAGKWVYRIMAATDSLFTSEVAYQKALFDLLVSTNPDKSLTPAELAKQAYDLMYGNTAKLDNAAFKAFTETFGQPPSGTKQAEIDKEAQTIQGGDKAIYKARKLEIIQDGIDENIKNEARRVANIQAYKGEQFGTLGLLSDKISEFSKGWYILQSITRFSGTAFKIINTMLDYSLYGYARAAGFSLGDVFLKKQIDTTSGRVITSRTKIYDPEGKITPEAKKAIEKAYRKQQLGRAILGTALGSLIPAIFASLGEDDDPRENYYDIIGNMDAYPRQYRELLKQAGVKPNSLKIGNVYIPFELILPLALNFGITANGKDLQRAARKLKEAYPEKYKDVTDESVNTFYEYAITQYTNPKPIASTLNTAISQSPLRTFSEGLSTVGDIMKKEAEVEDLVVETVKGIYKHIIGVVIPKITADFEKYSAIGLEKLGLIDVGAMAINNDKGFWTSIAYMSSLGDVTTGLGLTDPKRKIDAFGNIFEKEPNEYRMPVKVFERKFATEPIIQLQIASGVVKMPSRKAEYPISKQGKEVTEKELTEDELYKYNLGAGKLAKEKYDIRYINEDMALLETDKPKAVERIKKTSAAVLEYARLQYLYDNFMVNNRDIPPSVKALQLKKIREAERAIYKARNTK